MNNSKLTDKEEVVLRMLKIGYSSKEIPTDILDIATKDRLLMLNLVILDANGKYTLTYKALEVLNTGGFIVKYPIASKEGTVANFNTILESYSPEALKALGLSIINTKVYKKWGKFNNVTLFDILKDTINYYANFDHVTTRLDMYMDRILQASSDYEKVLNSEFNKITPFKLINPIKLGVDEVTGFPITLVEINSASEGTVIKNKEELVSLAEPKYTLTPYMKNNVIRQYNKIKSSS